MLRLFMIATTFFSVGCATHAGTLQPPNTTTTSSWTFEQLEPLIYTPQDWPVELEAFVYRPKRPGKLPAVLVVHGGGWSRRSPADMHRICKTLATRGFVAVNVAYRLAPEHTYPAPVHDLRQALDWMVANADFLQIDPMRIGAFGYSAGAHLVGLLAVLETAGHPISGATERGTRLQAVVAGGIPADLTRWPKSTAVRQFLGASYKTDRARWIEASPVSHVTPHSPPFFLYHGGIDQLVEIDQAHALKSELDAAGVPAQLYTLPYHGHFSMFLLNRSAVHRAAEFLTDVLESGS